MRQNEKTNFPQSDINTAVEVHILDKTLEQKKAKPSYCAVKSDPPKKIFSYEKCARHEQIFACDLCNPHRKV